MHKHAKIIMEWAQMMQLPESEWRKLQYECKGGWYDCGHDPAFYDYYEYRWQPRTIRIGDIDVPEPKVGGIYTSPCELHLIFETVEDVNIALKALKSLTQKKE